MLSKNELISFFLLYHNISHYLLFLILFNQRFLSSLIKIPFQITQYNSLYSNSVNHIEREILFNLKLFSLTNIGYPPQIIETYFNLESPNYFISNYCKDSSTSYIYNKSNTFNKLNLEEKQPLSKNEFYINETYYLLDLLNNEQITVNNMLMYTPIKNDNNKNCLNIGLKFQDNLNNKVQESFIYQLKHKNIINKYFWTMILYNNRIKVNDDYYDGEFIFGDILKDYYKTIDKEYSYNKLTYTYTGNINKKNENNKNSGLEWGLVFDIYYETKDANNENNKIIMSNSLSEFDYSMKGIIGTFKYFKNIQGDYFNVYIRKRICKTSVIENLEYKYIYCDAQNFTINDLQKFPSLNFQNKDLNYIFILNYQDLFFLTSDKKYYVFNIMIDNAYYDDRYDMILDEEKWKFGLIFWKKYQFSFDVDNKLIYFYNIEINVNNKESHNSNGNTIINEEIENNKDDTDIGNNEMIINPKGKNEIENKEAYEGNIVIKIIFIFILILIFIIIFCFLIIILFKLKLFKKGYSLIKVKKASELENNDFNINKRTNLIKEQNNNNNNKELEMQIKDII